MRPQTTRPILALAGAVLLAAACHAPPPRPSTPAAIGREAALAIEFPALDFRPPEPTLHTLPGGVEVLYLEDRSLPIVTLLARFEGGFGHFPRAYYAAGMALPSLLRSGGTRTIPPDSLELLMEAHSVQTSFGTGGGSVTSTMNVLTRELDTAFELWGQILKEPGFDSARVDVWRGQELESVARRSDDGGRLAVSTFNRLMYGDHPIGWEMSSDDLSPSALSPERLHWLHRRILCPTNLILGVTGDLSWNEAERLLIDLLADWPPCEEPLPELPVPTVREGGGVFLIPRTLEQSTIVIAHRSAIRQDDSPEFFASRIGNAILGGGGFSSRLLTRLRTEEGYAYSASSLWTSPTDSDGLVGAFTQTRGATTVAATRLMLEIAADMVREAPRRTEVETAVDEAVNGFVFNFDSPDQIVFRQMLYRADGLPTNWLEAYLAGLQAVTPEAVLDVFRSVVRPDEMTILVVGDPESFAEPLDVLGPVTILEVAQGGATPLPPEPAAPPATSSPPSGAPRFRR